MPEPENPFQPPQAPPAQQAPIDPKAGIFAPCPNCGQREAKRVGFTLWGGALGPKLFTHVKCHSCGNKYNGKTGQSNMMAITLYTVGSIVIGLIVGVAAVLMMQR